MGSIVLNIIKVIGNRLPAVHLVAVSVCAVIVGFTLMLVPSEEVSATRGDQSTLRSSQQETLKLDLKLDKEPSTPGLAARPAALPATSADSSAEATPEAATVQTVSKADQPTPKADNWVDYKVTGGDNLSTLFKRAGLSARDVFLVSEATKDSDALKRLYPGESLSFLIQNGELKKLKHLINPLKQVVLEQQGDGYSIDVVEKKPDIEHRFAYGTIESSLFLDGEKAGLPSNTIMEMAALFGWDVDFALDIRKGDSFRVIYEEKKLDGKVIGTGDIVAAEFTNQGDTFTSLRYTDSKGNTSYYTPKGESMRKAFLRTPVDFARISSNFNLSRRHPVLNKIRAHKGVDYAASTGTPIKASGDGKIIFRGVKGGYGNVIILQHGNNINTLYAHMSRFKKGLSVGSRIKQGQLIGYVGMSGMVTGPHLHYEFQVNGVHKNPVTVKLPHADPVPKSERASFQATSQALMAQLETYSKTQVASAE
ncbi:OapA family protein [Marinobacterium rhizophilum]|uniref:Peptidoglycan DD-metalloendopeptidase family protein n=1 Tax=Marinobacterium rhizophilum TaxID=420402 RepID=A0ABY5HH39_9GAMM|nr:peptidoglycan DD-metalloendopeptidase family protein [Marinobacterium rhizophilum]UTW10923.1 peptidoglycan DD-metalloendopeptidase family protein [Marinobacterium rhizophilum]